MEKYILLSCQIHCFHIKMRLKIIFKQYSNLELPWLQTAERIFKPHMEGIKLNHPDSMAE